MVILQQKASKVNSAKTRSMEIINEDPASSSASMSHTCSSDWGASLVAGTDDLSVSTVVGSFTTTDPSTGASTPNLQVKVAFC